MSFAKFGRAILAYLFASLTVLPVAVVGAEIGRGWGLTFWPIAAGVWLLAVGVPSVGWASAQLSRNLGVRPAPTLRVAGGGWRSIPVAGGILGDVLPWALPSRREPGPGGTVTVVDQVYVTCGDFTFLESDLLPVLRRGWIRQRGGRHALARSYWLDRDPFNGDRRRYDSFCDSLESVGALVGRGDRTSGRLARPPLTTLQDMRYLVLG